MENMDRKRHRIFLNFSLSFLFFIVIPVLILNIAIWLAVRITETNERQNCVTRLSEGRNKIDLRIRDIHNIVNLLRKDGYINALEQLSGEITVEDQYGIWLALQSLGKLAIVDHGINIALYYKDADLVLSSGFRAGSMTMNSAWGSIFRFGNYDYAGFLSAFCFDGNRPVFFPDMDCVWGNIPLRGILYGMKLQIGSGIYVFSLLEEQKIKDSFSPVFSGGGALYVYDAGGTILYSRGGGFPPEKITAGFDKKNGLLPAGLLGPGIIGAYSRSDYGLFYVSALETGAMFNNMRHLWNIALALNIAAIVLLAGYALLLATRNSRQIGEAFQLLNKAHGSPSYEKGDVLKYLNNSVERLVNAHIRLRADADSRQEILKIAFIDRFFNDNWESPQEAASAAEQAGIPIDNRRFCMVFLAIRTLEKEEILDILEKALPPKDSLIYSRNPNRIGIFFALGPEHWEKFRDYIGSLFQNGVFPLLPKTISLHLAGSSLYDEIFGIRDGYRICREHTLVCNDWDEARIHWIDFASSPHQRILVFPLDAEQRLINQLRNADFGGAQNSIRSVFAANVRGGGMLSERMLAIFYSNLQSCFLKSLNGPLTDLWRDAIEDIDFNCLPQEMENNFIELARCVCASSGEEDIKKKASIRKEDLTAYVEEHFGEEQLSLGLAARHFGFSEPYFSQMFKDVTGEKFSVFTELTRLNHAQTLLKQYLKVEEVAYRCGYNSYNTFRKAYKRHFGNNPTQGRN